MSQQQALIPNQEGQYAVVAGAGAGLLDALADNLGGDQLSWTDLTRIKVPSGGQTLWEVPNLEGTENLPAIEGVIVLWQMMRSFWATNDPVPGTPPDCVSDDAVLGKGAYGENSEANPSGRCDRCPMAQWGTGKDGNGQACKMRRLLFIVRPDDLLPIVVATPSGSLKNVKQYFLALAGRGLPFYSVVTKLRLEKAKSVQGITYAQIVPQMAGRLEPEQIQAMKGYGEQLRMAVKGTVYDAESWSEDAA